MIQSVDICNVGYPQQQSSTTIWVIVIVIILVLIALVFASKSSNGNQLVGAARANTFKSTGAVRNVGGAPGISLQTTHTIAFNTPPGTITLLPLVGWNATESLSNSASPTSAVATLNVTQNGTTVSAPAYPIPTLGLNCFSTTQTYFQPTFNGNNYYTPPSAVSFSLNTTTPLTVSVDPSVLSSNGYVYVNQFPPNSTSATTVTSFIPLPSSYLVYPGQFLFRVAYVPSILNTQIAISTIVVTQYNPIRPSDVYNSITLSNIYSNTASYYVSLPYNGNSGTLTFSITYNDGSTAQYSSKINSTPSQCSASNGTSVNGGNFAMDRGAPLLATIFVDNFVNNVNMIDESQFYNVVQ